MYRLMGEVTKTEWCSKVDSDRLERGRAENLHEGVMSKPVPPPRPDGRGVWEKEKVDERAAGVVVL